MSKKPENVCPKCSSTEVSGLVQAFWAQINKEGAPVIPLHRLVESETEIGGERLCGECGHEWED